VLDIAQAHLLALDAIAEVSGQAFNVGNSRGYSILEVLSEVRRITGHAIPAKFVPRRAGDPAMLVAASTKLQNELHWKPESSMLSAIVESAWNWKKRFPAGYPASSA
jgi:UDP-glucose 4-epimerase